MEMLELLRGLVQIESPTGDTQELCERVIRELEELGFTAARDGEGIRAERPGEGAPLLLLAHLDTVWERGTLARMPWRVEGERAFGPRAHDTKGGVVVLLEAPRRTAATPGLRVVFTAHAGIRQPARRPPVAPAARGP